MKNGTAISGIGYMKFLVVTGWAISLLLCTIGLREQCVLTCLVCCASDLTACDYGTVPPPVLVPVFFLLAVCKYRGGRPGRFGHVQLHQVDRG